MADELKLIQQDVDNVAEDIRSSYKNPIVEMYSKSNNSTSGIDALINSNTKNKGLQEYSDIKFSDAYEKLNSGDYVAKYPNLSVVDLNQEERLAQQQDISNKWSNGIKKFLGKVGTGVLGGTVGTLAGVKNFIEEGTMESIYDNDFNRWLDDLNTKMDFKLPNYYTQKERDKSLVSQMGTANFWANDLLGGAAFTVSALGSEAIWAAATGGTSLATSFARIGARAAGLYSKGSKGLKALKEAKNLSKIPLKTFSKGEKTTKPIIEQTKAFGKAGMLANTARFTLTSAGYEAGFEARHFMNEEIDKFEQNFEELNGRPPTSEDREKFYEDATKAANNLFSFNLALVGSSNLAIFGKAFGLKSPFKMPKKYFNRTLFGIGNKTKVTKKGKEQIERVTANKLQKFVRSSYSLGKPMFLEGFVEEGGQGMGGSAAGSWVQSGYDAENYKTQIEMAEAISNGFSEAYGTKEGQKEILIGSIIGLISGAGVNLSQGKSPFGDIKSMQREANLEYAYRKNYNADKAISDLQKASRAAKTVEDIELAEESGDTVGAETGRKKLLLTHIVEAEKFDFSDEAKADFQEAINRMSDEEVQEQFGFETKEEAQEYKQNIIQEYSQIQADYKDYRDFTEYFLTDVAKKEGLSAANTEVLKEAIAVELTLGKEMNNHAADLLTRVKEELTQGMYNSKAEAISRALTVEDILSSASKETRQIFQQTRKELKQTKRELEELDKKRLETNKKKPAEQLNQTVGRIEELQEKIRVLEAENEAQLSAMVLENPYNKGDQEYITAKELDNIDKELEYVEQLMNTYKDKNPQKYAKLSILLRDYATVKKGLQKFSDLNNQLSDPNLGLRGKRNLIKELMLDKEPHQITKDLFETVKETQDEIIDRRKTYTGATEQAVEDIAEEAKDLTPEELKQFEDTGDVTDGVVNKIAKKRKENQDLTEQETAIYNKAKERVDKAEVDLGKTSMEAKQETTPEKDERTPIQKIIDNNKYLVEYLGTDENAKMPTEQEMEEYRELLSAVKKDKKLPFNKVIRVAANYFAKKGIKTSLTPAQLQRFKDLNQKVQDFQLYKHYETDEGITLAELIEQEVSREQDPQQTEPLKKEVTEEDHIELLNKDEKPEAENLRNETIIQTYEGSRVRKLKDGYYFSHLKLFTFLSKMAGLKSIKIQEPSKYDERGNVVSHKKAKSVDLKDIEKYEGVPDLKITATAGDTKITLNTKSRARINVSSAQLNDLLELTGLKIYKNALEKGNTYSQVYEVNEEGVDVQKENEFEMQDDSGKFKGYDPQHAYNMEKGDTMYFRLNKQDRWNKKWLKAYKDGLITKDKLIETVKVYIFAKGGVALGDLKSAEGVRNGSDYFHKIRKAAVEELLKEGTQTDVELSFSAPMAFTFLGTPVVRAKDGKPIEQDLTDETLEEVEDYGTYKDGKLNLVNKSKKVRTDFVSKLKNAPVIVIRKGKYLIAYPVSLKRNEGGLSKEFSSIMGSNQSKTKKATEVNNLLAENGAKPNLYYNSAEDQNMIREDGSMTEQLLKAEEILNEKSKYPDPQKWSEKGFTKDMLKDEIKTSIDLTGKKFISAKPVMDFSKKDKEKSPTLTEGNTTSTGQFNEEVIEDAEKESKKDCPK